MYRQPKLTVIFSLLALSLLSVGVIERDLLFRGPSRTKGERLIRLSRSSLSAILKYRDTSLESRRISTPDSRPHRPARAKLSLLVQEAHSAVSRTSLFTCKSLQHETTRDHHRHRPSVTTLNRSSLLSRCLSSFCSSRSIAFSLQPLPFNETRTNAA